MTTDTYPPSVFFQASVQFSSVTQSCPTLCDPMNCSTPGLPVNTNSRSSLKFTSIKSVMPSSHLILCCPLLLLPPIPPSIKVFSNESTLRMRWPKYWSFSFRHHSFQRKPRVDLLQNGLVGPPCSPRDSQESSPTPQFKSINSSVLSFFTVQLSHPYMTTGETIALTRWTFVDKVMSLLFNMLSRLVITFLPRSKRLLTLWMQSPSIVILEPQNKV